MTIRDKLVAQCGDDQLLFMDGFDDCIIGLCDIHCQNPRVAYDVTKILKSLEAMGMGEDEAREYYEFNIECCYVGEYTPALIDLIPLEAPSEEAKP